MDFQSSMVEIVSQVCKLTFIFIEFTCLYLTGQYWMKGKDEQGE